MKRVRGKSFFIVLVVVIFCVTIYLPGGAFVEGMGQNEHLPDLSFSSSFIQKWYCKDFTLDRWISELEMLHSGGVNEIILQNVIDIKEKESYYKTNLYGYKSTENDIISLALEAAKMVGIKVRIGLGENSDWWVRGVIDENWLVREAVENKLIFNEIYELYGQHEALGGWYIPYEFSGHFVVAKKQRNNLNTFLKDISNEIRNKSDLDIMISPYYNFKLSGRQSLQDWSNAIQEVFKDTKIDIVALQDSIGVQYNNLNNVRELFYYTKQATDELNIKLYSDVETFEKEGSGYISVGEEQIERQMRSVRPYVEGYVAFSINHYQNSIIKE